MFVAWKMSRRYRDVLIASQDRRCARFPGREIYRLIRAFGFASQRDFVVRSGARTEEKQSQRKSASIQCPYSLWSYVTESYLDTGAYRGRRTQIITRDETVCRWVCCSVAKHFRPECHKHSDRSSEAGRPVFGTPIAPIIQNASTRVSRGRESLHSDTFRMEWNEKLRGN